MPVIHRFHPVSNFTVLLFLFQHLGPVELRSASPTKDGSASANIGGPLKIYEKRPGWPRINQLHYD